MSSFCDIILLQKEKEVIKITNQFFSSFLDFWNFFYFPKLGISDILEIAIIVFATYKLIERTKYTRTWTIIKGILFFFIFYIVSCIFSFNIIEYVFENAVTLLGFTIIGLFQPELRRIFEQLGNKNFSKPIFSFRKKKNKHKNFSDETIKELTDAAFSLGAAKTGALIVIEKQTPLNEYISTGIPINGKITSSLLINIFEKNTPLHDGAVIIRNDEIISATCYLPLSNDSQINKTLGTRHRAAIGINEAVDCFVIVVSEETGAVSIVRDRKLLHNISKEEFKYQLTTLQETNYNLINISDKKPQKEFFKRNFKNKIISLIVGVLLWFSLMNISDPITTKSFSDIPISVTNAQNLEDINKTYSIQENQTISVVLKGHRSLLDTMSKDEIVATVDVTKLSSINTSEINIEVKSGLEVISSSQKTVDVEIDDISHAEWPVEVEQTGTVLKEHWVNKIKLDSETLLVSGPKTLLNKINQVKVSVDITNKKDGDKTTVTPVLYDKNGDTMDNSKFSFNSASITATILLFETKTVPVKITPIDEKGTQGTVNNILFKPEEITIAGPDDILKQTNSIDISLPIKIDITTNNSSEMSKTINVNDYLPENIILASKDEKIVINITFTPFAKKEVILKTSSIKVSGLKSDYKLSFANETFNATIIAPEKGIQDINSSNITASFDFSSYNEGEYEITPSVKTNKFYVFTNDKISCKIEKK